MYSERGISRRQLLKGSGAVAGAFLLERASSPIRRELPPLPEFKRPEQEQRVLVIPITDSAKPGFEIKPFVADDLTEASGWDAYLNDVSNRFRRMSWGKIDYQFAVRPWYVSPKKINPLDEDEIARLGDASVRDVPDIASYQTKLYVTPYTRADAGGLGNLKGGRAWIFAENLDDGPFWKNVIGHELGHTLGLPHVSFRNERELTSYKPKGNDTEYAEDTLMGVSTENRIHRHSYSPPLELTVPEKISLGLLDASAIQDVSTPGLYAIDEFSKGQGIGALRINKPNSNDRYYITTDINPKPELSNNDLPYVLQALVWDEQLGHSVDLVSRGSRRIVDRVNGIVIESAGLKLTGGKDQDIFMAKHQAMVKVTFTKSYF